MSKVTCMCMLKVSQSGFKLLVEMTESTTRERARFKIKKRCLKPHPELI